MEKEKIQEAFLTQDRNCAEAILCVMNEQYHLNLTPEDYKLVSGFGGGCGCGLICGALAGCLSAWGKMRVEDRGHATPGFKESCGELCRIFEKELGGVNCADLRPRYFEEDIRCLHLLEKAADCFENFAEEK